MTVYLLHFERPISRRHTTQHYLGSAEDVRRRIEQHRNGRGSRLCQVAKERGIAFVVARLWPGGRRLERRLKRQKNSPRLCPLCNRQAYQPSLFDAGLDFRLDDVPDLSF